MPKVKGHPSTIVVLWIQDNLFFKLKTTRLAINSIILSRTFLNIFLTAARNSGHIRQVHLIISSLNI